VKSTKVGAHEILSEMPNKEYLVRRDLIDTMHWLNRVFAEFGIQHGEHDVPMKVHKSLEDKAKKATTKNATTMAEAKKRRGAGASKVISEKQKTLTAAAINSTDASTAASVDDDDDEVAENIGGGSSSVAAGMGGERSVASLDVGGDDFVNTTLQGMGGSPTAEPSIVPLMLNVLGDDSSGSEDKGAGGDNASPSKDEEADSADHHRPMVAPTMEVSEDEVEVYSLAALF
jgi:hypothetical protein